MTKLTVVGPRVKTHKLGDLKVDLKNDQDTSLYYSESAFFRICYSEDRPTHFHVYMIPIVTRLNEEGTEVLVANLSNMTFPYLSLQTEIELLTVEEIKVRVYA